MLCALSVALSFHMYFTAFYDIFRIIYVPELLALYELQPIFLPLQVFKFWIFLDLELGILSLRRNLSHPEGNVGDPTTYLQTEQ